MAHRWGWMVLAALVIVACASDGGGPASSRRSRLADATRTAPDAAAATDAALALAHAEPSATESAENRDPFRPAAGATEPLVPDEPRPGLDQLRLIATITGGAQPCAMVEDPSTVGHVLRRGDFVGSPTFVVQGGLRIPTFWRVERIRPNEVVLARSAPGTDDALEHRTLTLGS